MSIGPEAVPSTPVRPPASTADRPHASPERAHLVQFYEDDEVLAAAIAKFVADGLSAAAFVTTIATPEHTEAVERHLRAARIDVDAARASGRLLSLDAHETLAKFMRGGEPDRRLFESVIGGLMRARSTAANGAELRAYGEMVDILWKRGDQSAALHLEELWNDLQARLPFTLLCAYGMGKFYKEPATIHSVCAKHTLIVGLDQDGEQRETAVGTTRMAPDDVKRLAREILHREEVELALRESLRQLRSREEELRESEEQLRDFFENGTVSLHRVGADGRILWANRAELDLLGYEAESYIGRPIGDFHVDQALIGDILARLIRGEALHDVEAQLRAKDGTTKHVLISSSGYFRDGKFVHSRCFTRDITERRKAEHALRDSEQQLQLITDALPICISYIDSDVRYRFVSATYEQWFGRSKQELVGRRVEEVIGARAYEELGPYIARALAGEPVTYQGEVPYLEDRTRFVEATYIPQRGKDQQVVGIVALISDVSERKAFERFRAAAAERAERLLTVTAALAGAVTPSEVFEAVVDQVAVATNAATATLWLVDNEARTLVLARCVGFDEPTKRRFAAVPLNAVPSIPALDAVRRGEPVWIPSKEVLLRDYPHLEDAITQSGPYRVACLPLGSQGDSIGVLAIISSDSRDITEDERSFLLLIARYASQAIQRLRLLEDERRSRADADAAATENARLHREAVNARARAEQLYRFAQAVVAADRVEVVFDAALAALETAVGATRAAVLICDSDGVMRFRASRKLSEKYRQSVEGHSPWPRDAVAPQPVLIRDVEADPSMTPFLPLFHDEGIGSLAFIPLVTRGQLIGKFMLYYAQAHDYSEQEIELVSSIAHHLASVTARFAAFAKLEETIRYNDLFAGVLAHDLRNPLGAMMTAAQILLIRNEAAADLNAKPVSRILSSGQRMLRMIDQLLDLTRARAGGGITVQPRDANLRDLCNQALDELELAFPRWTITRESVGELDGAWDSDRLLQVISNLASNAGQHGRPEGVLDVKLDGSNPDAITVCIHNGGAIRPSLLPNLFDPFRGASQRPDASRGLGLGLFIVKELVRAHGGTVEVSSAVDKGTTFTVRLPRRATGALAFDSSASRDQHPGTAIS